MASDDEFLKTLFPSNLVYLRSKAGLTQSELGKLAGVTWSQISRYESGASRPRKGVMMKLAKALDVHPQILEKGNGVIMDDESEEPTLFIDPENMDFLSDVAKKRGITIEEAFQEVILEGMARMKNGKSSDG